MNILIVNDDGPEALGLKILREITKERYPKAKVVTLASSVARSGQGFSVSCKEDLSAEEVEPFFYVLRDASPVDLIYAAFCSTRLFLSAGEFDLVLSGVNHGANVGLDVVHSGTTSAAMMAAKVFNAPAIAFSQEFGRAKQSEQDRFLHTGRYIANYLSDLHLEHGECHSVNIPAGTPKGFKRVRVAPYSRWPSRVIPDLPKDLTKMEDDIQSLAKGYITVSPLELSWNVPLRY